MAKKPATDDARPVIARLTLIVTYETLPDPEDVREVVEAAKGLGRVEKAMLEVLTPSEIDLS